MENDNSWASDAFIRIPIPTAEGTALLILPLRMSQVSIEKLQRVLDAYKDLLLLEPTVEMEEQP